MARSSSQLRLDGGGMDAVDEILAQWQAVRPDLNVTPMGLVGRISRVSTLFAAEMARTFERHGLNASAFDVLATLRRSGPPYTLSAGELMSRMMISSGTTTNRIQRLVSEGLVERTVDATDARKAVVSLTPAGMAAIERAVAEHVATQAKLVDSLDPDEADQLVGLLRKLEATYLARATHTMGEGPDGL